MKKEMLEISPQYIIDSKGKKTGVVLDILTFEHMLEKLEELYLGLAAEKALENEDEFVDFAEAKKRLLR